MITEYPNLDSQFVSRDVNHPGGVDILAATFRSFGFTPDLSRFPERIIEREPFALPPIMIGLGDVAVSKSGIGTYGVQNACLLALTDGTRHCLVNISMTVSADALVSFVREEFFSRVEAGGPKVQATLLVNNNPEKVSTQIAMDVIEQLNLENELHVARGLPALAIGGITEQGILRCGSLLDIDCQSLRSAMLRPPAERKSPL